MRACGECQACCVVFEVKAVSSAMRTACPHQGEGAGCDAYDARPADCREYACDWLGGLLAEDERPDRVGLIVDSFVAQAEGEADLPYRRVMEARPHALEREPRAAQLLDRLRAEGPVHVVWWEPYSEAWCGPAGLCQEAARRLAED